MINDFKQIMIFKSTNVVLDSINVAKMNLKHLRPKI